MGKVVELNDIKNKKSRKKNIIYFIFIIIFIYVFYSIFLLVNSSNEAITVDKGTVTIEETTTGYIIRDETVLTGNNYSNGLIAIISEGERTAKGDTIFRYIATDESKIEAKIQELNLKIQEAFESSSNKFPADIKNLDKQIDSKIQDLKTLTDVHTISEYKKTLEEITNKKAKIVGELSPSGSYIKELTDEKENYEKQLTENSEYITAPISGVVSYRVDGLEDVLSPKDFSTLTEESLDKLEIKTGKIVSTSQSQGKIINNFECYLATVLESDIAKQAEVGDKVTINFSSGNDIETEINYVANQESGKVLIIFKLDIMPEELIQYRKISFNITWSHLSGLKVPNTSIVKAEDGLDYVIRKKNDKQEKVLVKVLKRNDKYSIINSYSTEELGALGIDVQNYSKISQYDTILLYAEEK